MVPIFCDATAKLKLGTKKVDPWQVTGVDTAQKSGLSAVGTGYVS